MPPAGGTPNPQLLSALSQIRAVRSQIESLFYWAQQQGSVRVGERQIRSWQRTLRSALTQIDQIPVILIYPPPPFAVFAGQAERELEAALDTLDEIPIMSLRIYPPQPGVATIDVQTLRSLLIDLRQAEAAVMRALRAS